MARKLRHSHCYLLITILFSSSSITNTEKTVKSANRFIIRGVPLASSGGSSGGSSGHINSFHLPSLSFRRLSLNVYNAA